MYRNWYKLDNAAKIFPTTSTKYAPNVFRLSALFFEEVDPVILKQAVKNSLDRFDVFKVKMKRGFFWYYLDTNNNEPLVIEESYQAFHSVNFKDNNGFLFSVLYNGKRVAVEIFHSLTDANGGMEFLKTISYNYLILKGVKIDNDGSILTSDIEVDPTESEDSFVTNYQKDGEVVAKAQKVFKLSGESYENFWNAIFHITTDVSQVKSMALKYDATITEFLGGVLLYSVYEDYKEENVDNMPLSLFIPVNARKYYNSKSLRNFMSFIRSLVDVNEGVTLEKCVNGIKHTLRDELSKEFIQTVINSNVTSEKNVFVRPLPLVIKKVAMKVGYKIISGQTSSICLSNIGEVKTPEIMKEHIDRFEFVISPSLSLPIISSIASYNGRMTITFSKNIKQRSVIKRFVNMLSKECDVVIDTNDLEVK